MEIEKRERKDMVDYVPPYSGTVDGNSSIKREVLCFLGNHVIFGGFPSILKGKLV